MENNQLEALPNLNNILVNAISAYQKYCFAKEKYHAEVDKLVENLTEPDVDILKLKNNLVIELNNSRLSYHSELQKLGFSIVKSEPNYYDHYECIQSDYFYISACPIHFPLE